MLDRLGVGEAELVTDRDGEGAGVPEGVGDADGDKKACGAGTIPRKVEVPAATLVESSEPAAAAFASAAYKSTAERLAMARYLAPAMTRLARPIGAFASASE